MEKEAARARQASVQVAKERVSLGACGAAAHAATAVSAHPRFCAGAGS